MNAAAAIAAIEANLAAKTAYGCAPDEMHYDAQVHWFRTAERAGIVWADFAEATLDQQVTATLAMLDAESLTWWVGAYSQPFGLGRALQRHGLWHNRDMLGMAAVLTDLPPLAPLARGLVFERIRDDAMLQQWHTITAQAFRMNAAAAALNLRQLQQYGYTDDCPWQHFVIHDGTTVLATSSLFNNDHIAGLYNIATLPTAREQGLGQAITLHTFDAVRTTHTLATLQTTFPNALRLYHRMGFEVYCKIGIYQR